MTDRLHRRGFVRSLAVGASAGAIAAPAAADEPAKDKEKGPAKLGAPSEADARMALVVARFGARLDANARDTVRAEVESIVHRAEHLRKFPLDNGDGPFPVFVPYRAPLAD
jgi:hypothetical protein